MITLLISSDLHKTVIQLSGNLQRIAKKFLQHYKIYLPSSLFQFRNFKKYHILIEFFKVTIHLRATFQPRKFFDLQNKIIAKLKDPYQNISSKLGDLD